LGWEPWRSLRETLPSMVGALTADPAGWYESHKLSPPSWLVEARQPVQEEAHAG
jgi:hypothetical protein